MPLPTETVNVDVTNFDATEIPAGRGFIEFELTSNDVDVTTNHAIPKGPLSIALDASGQASVSLWPNDQGAMGTYYKATVVVADETGIPSKASRFSIGFFQIENGGGPYNLAAVIVQGITPGVTGVVSLPGRIRTGDGTAALPAYSFNDDPDTGIYRIGNNVLGFSTGGVEPVRMTTSGMQLTGSLTGTAVQSGPTDAGVNKLLKVGAFGLGGLLPAFTGNLDSEANDIAPGFYNIPGSAGLTGTAPPDSFLHACLHHTRRAVGGGEIQRIQFEDAAKLRSFVRSRGAGAWVDWVEEYNQKSILGTVSHTGGVPTGAIIERGSNANGEYVRFADGTQICWITANLGSIVASGSGTFASPYSTTSTNLDWPAAFAAGTDPQIACNGSVPSAAVSRTERLAAGTIRTADRLVARQCTVTRLSSDSTVQDGHIDVIATGYWF